MSSTERGTKFCSWHREMPPFNWWRQICITYDAFRDVYKLYVDGEKVDSGSFAGENQVQPIRPGGIFVVGQDQVLTNLMCFFSKKITFKDELDSGYNKRQSWAGAITQYNLWDFAIEHYDIENMAECRSDIFGNIVRWDQAFWLERNVYTAFLPTFQLCDHSSDGNGPSYFLFRVLQLVLQKSGWRNPHA